MQRIIQVIVNVLPINCNLCSFRLNDNCEILKLSIGHPYVNIMLDRRNAQCPLCLYEFGRDENIIDVRNSIDVNEEDSLKIINMYTYRYEDKDKF